VLLRHRVGLAQTAMLGMTNPHGHGEILVCATPIPLEDSRQTHVPLWAPIMIDGGVLFERVRWAGRAEVDALGAVVTVYRSHGVAGWRMCNPLRAIAHRSGRLFSVDETPFRMKEHLSPLWVAFLAQLRPEREDRSASVLSMQQRKPGFQISRR